MNIQEVQKITKFPEGTIKVYLLRARKLLKEKLQKDGYP
jgi:RNA polymerase sigma-70 factor (ECF subfamily)